MKIGEITSMIKEATASALIFSRDQDGPWLVAFIYHPRLNGLLAAGGHTEVDENPAECVLREVYEEAGYTARLVPGPAMQQPRAFPHSAMPAPWWINEVPAAPDRHTQERHIHIDHVYPVVVDRSRQDRPPELRLRWFTEREITATTDVSQDSQAQAIFLFAHSERFEQ